MTTTTPTDHGTHPALVLASASPRRRELLAALGVPFATVATNVEERSDHAAPPPALLAALAPLPLPTEHHPTLVAWRKATDTMLSNAVVLGADTTVVLDGQMMNKPRDDDEAYTMLAALSGRTHQVYTGMCVLRPANSAGATDALCLDDQHVWLGLVVSDVVFGELSEAQIADYIATGEPRDKAGAYGIQGMGGQFVRAVHGSYTNVVGLPLLETVRLLTAAGLGGFHDPAETYRQWLKRQGKEPLPWPPTHP